MSKQRKSTRTATGSALTEMGPALLLILMMIFFPMLDLMALAASYCSCLYLNFQQTKEAAVVQFTDAQSTSGQVQKGVVDAWQHAGVGVFVKTTTTPHTSVSYRNGQQDPQTKVVDKFVDVTTTVTCQPFLTIPFPVSVPGLNAPMTFTMTSEAQMENPDNAP